MEIKTIDFRAVGGGQTTLDFTFPSTSGRQAVEVTSLKTRLVNGKPDGSSVQTPYTMPQIALPINYKISESIDGFEIAYPENPNNDTLPGTIILEQTESKKQCRVNITQQSNPIYKFYGLFMESRGNTFEYPNELVEFDINNGYFRWPGNGRSMIMKTEVGQEIEFKSFRLYCSEVNNYALYKPQLFRAYGSINYDGSVVYYGNCVQPTNLQFGLPWSSGTWEEFHFSLSNGGTQYYYYLNLKQK